MSSPPHPCSHVPIFALQEWQTCICMLLQPERRVHLGTCLQAAVSWLSSVCSPPLSAAEVLADVECAAEAQRLLFPLAQFTSVHASGPCLPLSRKGGVRSSRCYRRIALEQQPSHASDVFLQVAVLTCVFVVQVGGDPGALAMVQKYQSPVRVYKQPFELVMAVSSTFSSFCLCSASVLQPIRAQLCNCQCKCADSDVPT